MATFIRNNGYFQKNDDYGGFLTSNCFKKLCCTNRECDEEEAETCWLEGTNACYMLTHDFYYLRYDQFFEEEMQEASVRLMSHMRYVYTLPNSGDYSGFNRLGCLWHSDDGIFLFTNPNYPGQNAYGATAKIEIRLRWNPNPPIFPSTGTPPYHEVDWPSYPTFWWTTNCLIRLEQLRLGVIPNSSWLYNNFYADPYNAGTTFNSRFFYNQFVKFENIYVQCASCSPCFEIPKTTSIDISPKSLECEEIIRLMDPNFYQASPCCAYLFKCTSIYLTCSYNENINKYEITKWHYDCTMEGKWAAKYVGIENPVLKPFVSFPPHSKNHPFSSTRFSGSLLNAAQEPFASFYQIYPSTEVPEGEMGPDNTSFYGGTDTDACGDYDYNYCRECLFVGTTLYPSGDTVDFITAGVKAGDIIYPLESWNAGIITEVISNTELKVFYYDYIGQNTKCVIYRHPYSRFANSFSAWIPPYGGYAGVKKEIAYMMWYWYPVDNVWAVTNAFPLHLSYYDDNKTVLLEFESGSVSVDNPDELDFTALEYPEKLSTTEQGTNIITNYYHKTTNMRFECKERTIPYGLLDGIEDYELSAVRNTDEVTLPACLDCTDIEIDSYYVSLSANSLSGTCSGFPCSQMYPGTLLINWKNFGYWQNDNQNCLLIKELNGDWSIYISYGNYEILGTSSQGCVDPAELEFDITFENYWCEIWTWDEELFEWIITEDGCEFSGTITLTPANIEKTEIIM